MALGRADILRKLKSGSLVVTPISQKHLQPAGLQLSLGAKLQLMKPGTVIDPRSNTLPEWEELTIPPEGFELKPGMFVLGHTLEKVTIPNGILGMVDGRSTLARCGVTPHQCAMAIWPGHGAGASRSITLEIYNLGPCSFKLYEGLFVANLILHTLFDYRVRDLLRFFANLIFSRFQLKVGTPSYDDQDGRYRRDDAKMIPQFNGDILDLKTCIDPSQLV